MDIIKDLVTCKLCAQRLVDPIVLPCGETVCSEHARPDAGYVKCTLCMKVHEIPDKSGGFVRNKALARALEHGIDQHPGPQQQLQQAQTNSMISSGGMSPPPYESAVGSNINANLTGLITPNKAYTNASESVQRLRNSIEAYNEVKNNKELFIYEFFAHLRNKLDIFCEQGGNIGGGGGGAAGKMAEMDGGAAWLPSYEKMIVDEIRTNMREYESICKATSARSQFESVFDAIDELNACQRVLAFAVGDEKQSRAIELKARKKNSDVHDKLEELRQKLLLNRAPKFIAQNFLRLKNYE